MGCEMVKDNMKDNMKNKKTITFDFPDGSIYIAIALSIVYDVTLALTWLASICILWNILKAIRWIK